MTRFSADVRADAGQITQVSGPIASFFGSKDAWFPVQKDAAEPGPASHDVQPRVQCGIEVAAVGLADADLEVPAAGLARDTAPELLFVGDRDALAPPCGVGGGRRSRDMPGNVSGGQYGDLVVGEGAAEAWSNSRRQSCQLIPVAMAAAWGRWNASIVSSRRKLSSEAGDCVVPPARFERATDRLEGCCSIQLSYGGRSPAGQQESF